MPESKPDLQTILSQSPPPDGGIKAWTHVALLHIVFFNTWGVSNSFGVFQQFYVSDLLAGQSPSSISWIGSVQTACLFALGVFSGRATDAGYFRYVFFTGVFLQVFGLMMASLAQNYWQLFLAQGLCLGVGNGLSFIPALSTTSTYFRKNRAVAISIGAAGAALGGLIYPVLVQQLLPANKLGFGWTMRVMAFLMLATYVPCLIWYAPRLPPRKTGPLIDTTAFHEAPFLFFAASFFFNFWGVYTAFFYISSFARDQIGIANPSNLVIILNGAGVIGRLLPGIVADRFTGLFNLLVPLCFAGSLLTYLWSQVHSPAGLYVFVVINGLVAHAMQSMYPTVATTMTPDINKTGTRAGMITSAVSIAVLTGPAISGALIQQDHGGYLYAQMFAGTSICLSAFCMLGARVSKAGWKLVVKV
ncbi:putative monocarboxylate permease [Microdochium trichocladiopsis]|uniref:Monocarboxylate permease n=1 Tax=Microdochium trichocladiopsis TaxID=1682393 RepID=A0A9P8YLX2_9PEZI|nr:putative monocarboxylate permease [Microdochium trichocladiopsis]KAH7041439.1 putative monocarboxylate permease [Microdochium trichocladiopsis]